MYNRILVTTDGSSLSKKAVAHAIQLAALSGAELLALRVTPRYPQSYFEGSLPLGQAEVAKIEQQWATQAQASVAMAFAVGRLHRFSRSGYKRSPLEHLDASLNFLI